MSLAGHRLGAQQRRQRHDRSRRCATTSISSTSSAALAQRTRLDRDLAKPATARRGRPIGAARGGGQLRLWLEQPTIWRRSRLPTVTLKAASRDDVQPATVVDQLAPEVEKFTEALPPGYKVVVGGAVEESAKAQGRSTRSCR